MSDHIHHHEHDHDGHTTFVTHYAMKDYVIGFVLALILTAIPFWLVMGGVLPSSGATALAILLIGAVQMIVHMVYFLHMNSRSEGGWTLLALIFTVIIVAIALAGALWVMYHLNVNMMPGHLHDMPSM